MNQKYVETSDWTRLPADPLVSIVMPAYHHERYLGEAIEGVVRQQTDFPIELIVGEDGSTDRTMEIALTYQRAYPGFVRVLGGECNVGMHQNAARIIAQARGRYLAFCEGDDYWDRPNKLAAQVALLESDPGISLVCSSWRTVSEEGVVLVSDVLEIDKNCVHCFGLDDILAGRVRTLTVCAKTELIRRALQESPLCRAGRYPFGDAPMWVEASRRGRCMCLPQPYATYRLSLNSATRPRDIMDIYRFIAGASEFDRDVLGLYCLPQGEKAGVKARILATRTRLRALALLGESSRVREEMRWLHVLGTRPRPRDYLFYLLSMLTQAGTPGTPLRRWMLLAWRALKFRSRAISLPLVARTKA